MDITFSIIGTAGRKSDSDKLSLQHFKAMCIIAEELLSQFKESGYFVNTLVSGGAAYADHTAVNLYLNNKVQKLRLFLPAKFENGTFEDNGIANDPFKNPGSTCNHYHKQFSRKTGINSLSEIETARHKGAELIVVEKGFYARNALVAKSDLILAMTFGNGSEVKDGGTAHTIWTYLKRVKKEGIFDKSFHYNLTDGKVYMGCKVSNEYLKKQTEKS